MDNLLKYYMGDIYIRTGKPVNIAEQMDELEKRYRNDLISDIDSFDSIEEISAETYCDLNAVRQCLDIFNTLGYIDNEEMEAMKKYAESLRMKMLEALNG